MALSCNPRLHGPIRPITYFMSLSHKIHRDKTYVLLVQMIFELINENLSVDLLFNVNEDIDLMDKMRILGFKLFQNNMKLISKNFSVLECFKVKILCSRRFEPIL